MFGVFGTGRAKSSMAWKQVKLAARASSHEYPDVEKIKNPREQNLKDEANNKQLDSQDTQRSGFSS